MESLIEQLSSSIDQGQGVVDTKIVPMPHISFTLDKGVLGARILGLQDGDVVESFTLEPSMIIARDSLGFVVVYLNAQGGKAVRALVDTKDTSSIFSVALGDPNDPATIRLTENKER